MLKDVKSKFKGRGRSWVKINIDHSSVSDIQKILNENLDNSKKYIAKTSEHGYYWLRFKKANKNNSEFELRFKGSTIDHPESLIIISNAEVLKLENLENTPKKLFLEEDKKQDIIKKQAKTKDKVYVSKREIKKQEKLSNMSKDELISHQFDIMFYPTRPAVKFKLPDESGLEKFKDFMIMEGVINE